MRRSALESECAYREVASYGPTVELEVLSAPGLRPGTHMVVTAAAARSMMPRALRVRSSAARVAAVAARLVLGHRPRLKLPAA